MLRIPVTYDLMCEISQDMEHCSNNPEHCLITRNGKVAAIVWLNPISINEKADLLDWEKKSVIDIITKNQYELEEEYRRILNGW